MQTPCKCLGLLSHFTPLSHSAPSSHPPGTHFQSPISQVTKRTLKELKSLVQDHESRISFFPHSFQQTSYNKHGAGAGEPSGFAGATPTNSGPGSKYSPDQWGAGSLVSPRHSPAVTSSRVWRWASQGHFCPSLSEQDRALTAQLSIPCHLNDLRIIGILEPSITSTLRPQMSVWRLQPLPSAVT